MAIVMDNCSLLSHPFQLKAHLVATGPQPNGMPQNGGPAEGWL